MAAFSKVRAVDVCSAVGEVGSFEYISCQDYLTIATQVDEIKARINVIGQRISNIKLALQTNSNNAAWVARITETVQEFNDELTTLLAQQQALLFDTELKDTLIRQQLGDIFVDYTFGDLPQKIRNSLMDIGAVESEAVVLLSDLQAISPAADTDNAQNVSEVTPVPPASSTAAYPIFGTFETVFGLITFDGSNRVNYEGGHIIIDKLSGYVLEGHWFDGMPQWPDAEQDSFLWYESESPELECSEPHDGSQYWGRFEFTFNAEGNAFIGRYGICHEEPSEYGVWDGWLESGTGATIYIDEARDACANYPNGPERNACIFQEGWLHLQALRDCNRIGEVDESCVSEAREFYSALYADEDLRELAVEYGGLDDPYAGLAVVKCQLYPVTDAQGKEVSLGVCAEIEYLAIGPDRVGDADNDGIINSDDYCPEIAAGDNPSLDRHGCPATGD